MQVTPLQGKRAVKATALSLQINLHFPMGWWLPFFVTNTLAYSEDAPEPSGAKPWPGLLPEQPGIFNSLGRSALPSYLLTHPDVRGVLQPARQTGASVSGYKGKKERKQQRGNKKPNQNTKTKKKKDD